MAAPATMPRLRLTTTQPAGTMVATQAKRRSAGRQLRHGGVEVVVQQAASRIRTRKQPRAGVAAVVAAARGAEEAVGAEDAAVLAVRQQYNRCTG